jgi:hypothetical protein
MTWRTALAMVAPSGFGTMRCSTTITADALFIWLRK